MKQVLLIAVLAALLSGCASIPFPEAASVNVGTVDRAALVADYEASLPARFHLLSSIIFEYNWVTVAGLGYLELDGTSRSYKVSCMNHMGVKLFEFAGDSTGLSHQYVLEPLAKKGNLTAAVGEDIKHIYFDLVPADSARLIEKKHSLVFQQQSGEGSLEYEFSGEGMHLTSKTYHEGWHTVWRASYYEYLQKNGKWYPMGIVFTNYRFGYRLIVRQKEILD